MLLVFWVCLGISSSLWALVLLLCARQTSAVFSGRRYPGRKRQRWTVRWRKKQSGSLQGFPARGRQASHTWLRSASYGSQTCTQPTAPRQTTSGSARLGAAGGRCRAAGRHTSRNRRRNSFAKIKFFSNHLTVRIVCTAAHFKEDKRAGSTSHLLSSPVPAS